MRASCLPLLLLLWWSTEKGELRSVLAHPFMCVWVVAAGHAVFINRCLDERLFVLSSVVQVAM